MLLPEPVIVKVGGSLYDWPELGMRLGSLVQRLPRRTLLVPGGGPLVEPLRGLDRLHGLGEETSHWLALRALTVAAWFLARLLPESEVQTTKAGWEDAWQRGVLPILDCWTFAIHDEEQADPLPASWQVTSDAIAAHVANRASARTLLLLKSCSIPVATRTAAASLCLVDPSLPKVLRASCRCLALNLRTGGEPQELR